MSTDDSRLAGCGCCDGCALTFGRLGCQSLLNGKQVGGETEEWTITGATHGRVRVRRPKESGDGLHGRTSYILAAVVVVRCTTCAEWRICPRCRLVSFDQQCTCCCCCCCCCCLLCAACVSAAGWLRRRTAHCSYAALTAATESSHSPVWSTLLPATVYYAAR